MASVNRKGRRPERAAGLVLPRGEFRKLLDSLRRGDTLLRIGICCGAALVLWMITAGWSPPFAYRTGSVPRRDIVARVSFELPDEDRTRQLMDQRRRETLGVYELDGTPLRTIRRTLEEKLKDIVEVGTWAEVPEPLKQEFFGRLDPKGAPGMFVALRAAYADDAGVERLVRWIEPILTDIEQTGLLEQLDNRHTLESSSLYEIVVHPKGEPQRGQIVEVNRVRLGEVRRHLTGRLERSIGEHQMKEPAASEPNLPEPQHLTESQRSTFAGMLAEWISPQLRPTLVFNAEATSRARQRAVEEVQQNPVLSVYEAGQSSLADGGRPIGLQQLRLLAHEHEEYVRRRSVGERIAHSLASFGMYLAVYVLCGVYVFYRQPTLLANSRKLVMLLAIMAAAIVLAWLTSHDQWRAEIIPVILFGLSLTIAFSLELALLFTLALSLVVTLVLGQSLPQFVVLAAASSSAVLMLGRVRSRTRLIYVGLLVGGVATFTALGVGTLVEMSYGAPNVLGTPLVVDAPRPAAHEALRSLLAGSGWYGLCSVMAGVFMTGLLPFVEKLFDVQTDISLLELGDNRHPLLQELVRRAPGTYNHSINVASIGEAAADAIGANGLLVHVGAYFHDIGKMLKPDYFVENQGSEGNRHESLAPAMSTLVIISHVKDGANLARQHGLPQAIIDFIEQHHGTTLVEYFFRQATRQSESDPDGCEVDEAAFRYPGPRPQTKETAVLMLADAVESASRTLVDPTSSRIESLVREISMKRLLDGQFAECGLTLEELRTLEDSLIKSLTAVYHGRVKYPDQQTA